MNAITNEEALKGFEQGRRFIRCEFRMSKAERIKYLDKQTRKEAHFDTIKHTVEMGDVSAVVVERPPEGFEVEKYQAPCPKGTPCVLEFSGCETVNGILKFNGNLWRISAK